MSNTDLNPSYGSPFIAKSGQANPGDVMRKIIERHPGASADEQRELFVKAAMAKPAITIACLRYSAFHFRNQIIRLMDTEVGHEQFEEQYLERKIKQDEIIKSAKTIVHHALHNSISRLTFGELGGIADLDKKIIKKFMKKGKPHQVIGATLDAEEIDKILKGK